MRIQLLANIRWTFFAYDETVTTPSRLIFTFAIFALHICNILMVQKEELFIKSPKLQINHAYNNKLKSRIFIFETTLIKELVKTSSGFILIRKEYEK